VPLSGPCGTVGTDTVSTIAAKCAVTLLLASMVTVTGFVLPLAAPLQSMNS
jgi:hypothetical protein